MRSAALVVVLAVLPLAVSAAPAEWVDEWLAGELVAYGQTSVPLTTVKPAEVTETPAWGEGSVRYATLVFQETGTVKERVTVAVVEQGDDAAVYLDGNADRKLTPEEQAKLAEAAERPPRFGEPGASVWIAALERPYPRTIALRLNPIGGLLTCAVRGYARMALPPGGTCPAILVDSNANMLLDLRRDTLYLDTDGNGSVDLQDGRRPCAPRLEVGEAAVTFSAGQPIHIARWYLAPSGDVEVRCRIAAVPGRPDKLVACLSNETGGVYQVISTGEPVTLPAGKYRVESVFLQLTDKETWTYTFDRQDEGTAFEAQPGEPCEPELLGDIGLSVRYSGEPTPAALLMVEVELRTATGLALTGCTRGEANIGRTGSIAATITLEEPFAMKPIYQSSAGFG